MLPAGLLFYKAMELRKNPAQWRQHLLRRSGAIAAGLALSLSLLSAVPAGAAGLTCERIPDLMRQFLQKHYEFNSPNDELRKRVVDSFMRRLDPGKTLYLRDEATALEQRPQGVPLDVNEGDGAGLRELHEDLPKRFAAMEKYVGELVSRDDYAIDPNVTVVIDPEKRARPATVEEKHAI